MIKPSRPIRGCIFLSIILAIILLLISDNANSEKLVSFIENKSILKLTSNEINYDKSINKYLLLGNVIIKYGTIIIKSDSIAIYQGKHAVTSTVENTLNEILSKFYIFNKHEVVIESKVIEFNSINNEIKIKNAFIRNLDYKTPFYYAIAPTIIINTKNGTFKAYGGNNSKVKIMISSILDLKKFKYNE